MNPSDWRDLWRELACSDLMTGAEGEAGMVERWRGVARKLDSGGQPEPDELLAFILARLTPETTVLDVGAGIGRWTVPLAKAARQVTAVEPAAGMREVLAERAASQGLRNLQIVEDPWMEADVPLHDVVVAAHATYTTPDLFTFTCKMDALARRTCYMALRVPAHDGVIGELSEFFRGEWHDSPNFVVGYNLLLSAGFYANVLMESRPVRYWTDPSMDAAVARAKRHLHLTDEEQEASLREILSQRLLFENGAYRWPDGMRSALVWWDKS